MVQLSPAKSNVVNEAIQAPPAQPTTTTLAPTSPDPSQTGQAVALSATVSVPQSGLSVVFEQSVDLATWNLITQVLTNASGTATASVTFQTTGTYYIRARFTGSSQWLASTSGADTQTVAAPAPPPSTGPVFAQGVFIRKMDGPGLQTIAGLPFQGKAVLFWWTRQSVEGTTTGDYPGIGFATAPGGTTTAPQNVAIAWADDNGVSPSNAGRHSAVKAITILSNGTPTLDGEADLMGFTPDGFTLNWTSNPNPAQGTIVNFVVFGPGVANVFLGQFTGPAAGFAGPRSYTGVGFQGDVAFFLTSLQTQVGDSVGATFGFGAASGPLNRGALSYAVPDGQSPASIRDTQDQKVIRVLTPIQPPVVDNDVDLDTFDPDGFTLSHGTTITGNVLFWVLVIQGLKANVNSFMRPGVIGPQSVTGVGFKPDGVIFFSDMSTRPFGYVDTVPKMGLGAGSQLSTGTVKQSAVWNASQNAVTPENTHMSVSTAFCMRDQSTSGGAQENYAAYVSSDVDGFTVNWTPVQTSTTQIWFYIALAQRPTV